MEGQIACSCYSIISISYLLWYSNDILKRAIVSGRHKIHMAMSSFHHIRFTLRLRVYAQIPPRSYSDF